MTEVFDAQQSSTPGSTSLTSTPGSTGLISSSEVTSSGSRNETSTKDTAKEGAQDVAQEGVQGGKHVVSVVADQAKDVASQTGSQAQELLAEAKSELMEQAASQKNRVADQLHALAAEFGSMASKSDQDGLASGLAEQASRRVGTMAHWVSEREPGSLVGELKDFARAKPGMFLAVAAGIGLVAGRMTRGVQAGPAEGASSSAVPSQPGIAATGWSAGSLGVVPVPGSVERVPELAEADPTVGVGARYPDMVSEEPFAPRTPGLAP